MDMLKYIYTDALELSLSMNRLINLTVLADKFMIERL